MEELRKKANEILKNSNFDNMELSKLELDKLFEEINIHQIELQLQNDELREKNLQIEESKTRYFSLFNFAPVGYIVIDKKAIIKECNIKASEILQRRRSYLINHPFISRINSSDMSNFYEALELADKSQIKDKFEISLRGLNEIKYFEISINKYGLDLFLVILNDITERKYLEQKTQEQNQELVQLNDDKDRFMQILAHDLRNPFNTLLGFSNLLATNIRIYDINKIEKQINILNNIAKRTYSLLEDILLWSRAHSGKIPFVPQEYRFANICQQVISTTELTANRKDIKINYFTENDLFVYADKNMLDTVLINLLSNAIKFTNKNGNINIYAAQNESETIITISDNGIGINAETIPQLFDISQRITTEGTDNEKGTGLGLFLCKEFIEKHGGKIWVESEVGKGTEFKFTMPIRSEDLNPI